MADRHPAAQRTGNQQTTDAVAMMTEQEPRSARYSSGPDQEIKIMGEIADKAKGTANKVAGAAKSAAGKATDNEKLRREGEAQKAKGNAQNAKGEIKGKMGNKV
ncbi:CsbD family protein [Sulfitobacter alexandrii]|nr:CsbD family protein [Sulfitobacter alexandrii]